MENNVRVEKNAVKNELQGFKALQRYKIDRTHFFTTHQKLFGDILMF